MKFGGKIYDTQFTTSTGEKRKYFMHDMHKIAVDMTFAQMTDKKGIKKHGEIEVTVMYKEYKQLEYMKVMRSLNPDSLTISQNKVALRYINLIKEKRSRTIKGRVCADVRPQRCYITKEDASSPTISLESLFASLIINAHEGIDVVIFYVPRANLNADMP